MKKSVLLLLVLIFFNGCPVEPARRYIEYFGWSQDGTRIIAVVDDNGKPDHAQELITFDLLGSEQTKTILGQHIHSTGPSDKIVFAEDSVSFYATLSENIYKVSSLNGSQTLIATGHFLAASPSGKLILTMLDWGTAHNTDTYAILHINENNVRNVTTVDISTPRTFYPWFGFAPIQFLTDSLWVSAYSDSGATSLAIFDTTFTVKYSTQDKLRPELFSIAAKSGEIAYLSEAGFSIFDPTNQTVKVVKPSTAAVVSLEIAPNAEFIIYSVNENQHTFLKPSRLFILDLKTNVEKQLASNLATSAQLSPDGKSVAYFTEENDDIQLHVISVP